MSQITLFTDGRFPCPQRLALVIAELGIQVKETVHIDILKGQHKTPEFLKLNPSGAVPCIRDDAEDPPLFVSESRAIARYLAFRYGETGNEETRLLPNARDPVALAKFEEGASIELTLFDPAANRLVFEEYFKPVYFGGEIDKEVVADLRPKLSRALDMLEERLARQKFMAGEVLSVADFFHVPYMFHLVEHVWQSCLDGRPNLQSWWKSIKDRDSFRVVSSR